MPSNKYTPFFKNLVSTFKNSDSKTYEDKYNKECFSSDDDDYEISSTSSYDNECSESECSDNE